MLRGAQSFRSVKLSGSIRPLIWGHALNKCYSSRSRCYSYAVINGPSRDGKKRRSHFFAVGLNCSLKTFLIDMSNIPCPVSNASRSVFRCWLRKKLLISHKAVFAGFSYERYQSFLKDVNIVGGRVYFIVRTYLDLHDFTPRCFTSAQLFTKGLQNGRQSQPCPNANVYCFLFPLLPIC